MATLTKKTMILFDPKEYKQIHQLARVYDVGVGELIRQAVRHQFLRKPKLTRREALKVLTQNTGLIFSWKKWEQEYQEAKAKR